MVFVLRLNFGFDKKALNLGLNVMLVLYITLKPALVTDDQRRDWTFC